MTETQTQQYDPVASIRLPAELLNRIDDLAEADGVTRAEIVRMILNHHFDSDGIGAAKARARAVKEGEKAIKELRCLHNSIGRFLQRECE